MAHANFDPSLVRIEFPIAGCAIVTLDRPAAMNALSLAMRKQFVATIDGLQSDAGVRVLIVTGAGKAFCAGLDLKELGASRDLASTLPAEATDPVAALRRFPGPIVGATTAQRSRAVLNWRWRVTCWSLRRPRASPTPMHAWASCPVGDCRRGCHD
jgi:hypothetical protein